MYISQTEQAILKVEVGRVINDSKLIAGIIKRDKMSDEKRQMREGIAYYSGEHKILDKNFQLYYFQGKQKINFNKANNKVIDPFFTDLNDQKKDYIIGKEPSLNFKTNIFEKDFTPDFNEKFYDALDSMITNTTNKGIEWLHPFINENREFDFIIADAIEIIPDYDNTIKDKLLSVLRYYKIDAINEKGELSKKTRVEIWTDKLVYFYIETDKEQFILDNSENPNPRPHWTTLQKVGSDIIGIDSGSWGFVPFLPLPNNKLKMNDLKRIKSNIDLYDLILSGFGNEVEDHREIVIKIKNYDGTDNEQLISMLKESGVIKVKGDGDAEALTLMIPVEAKKTILEILKENIYKFGRGVDYSGLSINQPTNFTLQTMFYGLNLKADALIMQLKKLIKKFFETYAKFLEIEFNSNDLKIEFNKSMPTNGIELMNALNTNTYYSLETRLELDPNIKDVQQELERIKKEKESSDYIDLNENTVDNLNA